MWGRLVICGPISNRPCSVALLATIWTSCPGAGVHMIVNAARCAGQVQQLGSESLLPNLMEVKG